MYIVGANPLLSERGPEHAEEAFGQLEFLVVRTSSCTNRRARRRLLPAASFAEKEGPFTNSERACSRVRTARAADRRRAPGLVDHRGARQARGPARRRRRGRQFDYADRRRSSTRWRGSTPFLGGLSHARLDREGGLQWPCPTPEHPGTRFLYGESFPRGRGRFIPARQIETAAELPDADYPFVLNTGRLLYHWHGGTLTRRVQGLLELAPRLEVAIHPWTPFGSVSTPARSPRSKSPRGVTCFARGRRRCGPARSS